ncbi:amino acid permease [Thermogemmatispora sp.]|uniref:amino acid permease n=1 Tax=Thermogemmatispora sp. TaxID=1968838 RepID=UPI0035E424AF
MIGQQPHGRDARAETGKSGPLSRTLRMACPPALSHYYTRRALPRPLGSLDLCLLHFAALFAPGPLILLVRENPLAWLAAVLGALTFLFPMTLAVWQLLSLAPFEGALYAWTARLLGPYWGMVVGISDWLPGLLAAASALVSLVTTLQGLRVGWLAEPWQRGLVVMALLVLLLALGWQRQRTVQRIVNTLSALMLAIVLLAGIGSLVLLPQRAWRFSLLWRPEWSVAGLSRPSGSLAILLYLGYSVPLSMAGELRPGVAPGRPLLGGALLAGGSYLLVALSSVVASAGGPDLGLEMVLGHAASNLALVGLLAFYLCAAFVHTSAGTRWLFVASLDGLLPTGLARLNSERVPWRAFLVQTTLTGLLASAVLVLLPQMTSETFPSALGIPLLLATMALLRLMVAFFGLYVTALLSCSQPRTALGGPTVSPWLLWPGIFMGAVGSTLALLGILSHSWSPALSDATWTLVTGTLTALSMSAATVAALPATTRANHLAPRLFHWLQGEPRLSADQALSSWRSRSPRDLRR